MYEGFGNILRESLHVPGGTIKLFIVALFKCYFYIDVNFHQISMRTVISTALQCNINKNIKIVNVQESSITCVIKKKSLDKL
jgi:hypothetical protein